MSSPDAVTDSRLYRFVPRGLVPSWASSPWVRFITGKVGTLILAFTFLVVVTFSIVLLIPGDAARAAAGPDASLEVVEATREALGLNDPVWQRFLTYLGDIFSGTMGTSFRVGTVGDQILMRAPYTLAVAGSAILITFILAFALGVGVTVLTRHGRRRWLGTVFSWITAIVDSIPVYIRGTMLIIVFSLTFGLLPPGGAQAILLCPSNRRAGNRPGVFARQDREKGGGECPGSQLHSHYRGMAPSRWIGVSQIPAAQRGHFGADNVRNDAFWDDRGRAHHGAGVLLAWPRHKRRQRNHQPRLSGRPRHDTGPRHGGSCH